MLPSEDDASNRTHIRPRIPREMSVHSQGDEIAQGYEFPQMRYAFYHNRLLRMCQQLKEPGYIDKLNNDELKTSKLEFNRLLLKLGRLVYPGATNAELSDIFKILTQAQVDLYFNLGKSDRDLLREIQTGINARLKKSFGLRKLQQKFPAATEAQIAAFYEISNRRDNGSYKKIIMEELARSLDEEYESSRSTPPVVPAAANINPYISRSL